MHLSPFLNADSGVQVKAPNRGVKTAMNRPKAEMAGGHWCFSFPERRNENARGDSRASFGLLYLV